MLDGSTALHWAAHGGFISIISELLMHHANPTIVNGDGLTAYDMALRQGHEEAANMLEKAIQAGNA